MRKPAALLLLTLFLATAGCGRPDPAGHSAAVATSTSYLESAARDVLGGELEALRLAGPGACPGHFDIRPSQAAKLRRSRVLLRFDFQSSLDRVLETGGTNRPLVVAVAVSGGLGLPESYLSACRQIADALVSLGMLDPTNAQARLRAVACRLGQLEQHLANRVALAGLRGAPVIASVHQKDFCEWLGLNVVATFRAADMSSVADIDNAIRAGEFAGVGLVVANLSEGRRAADALAERLGARVAVFRNFPALEGGRVSFDDLLASNVDALLNAARP